MLSCQSLSRARLFATPWAAAHQAPLSARFSRQWYWNGLPFPSPGDLPNPGIEPRSPALQADSLPTELQGKPQSENESRSGVSNPLQPHGLYSPWNSPDENTRAGSLSLLQRIFPTHVSRIAGRFFTSWATVGFLLNFPTSFDPLPYWYALNVICYFPGIFAEMLHVPQTPLLSSSTHPHSSGSSLIPTELNYKKKRKIFLYSIFQFTFYSSFWYQCLLILGLSIKITI